MENNHWLELINQQQLTNQLRELNPYMERFGLTLSEEDMETLRKEKNRTLKEERRVEFGASIIPQMIYEFCDSAFLSQDNYLDTLIRLQEIFFLYKNEMQDEITDEELLHFMREQFDGVCYGDLDYLEGTCLEIFGEAIRAGYRGYVVTQGKEGTAGSELLSRWDRERYREKLEELFWE